MKWKGLILFLLITLIGCNQAIDHKTKKNKMNAPVKVSIVHQNGKYQMLVNQKPFYIKGAGIEFGKIKSLAENGGNSFRTWRINNGKNTGKEILDEAYKYGLLVTTGIEVGRERHGFDYNDSIAVKKQFNRIKKEVESLKNHPALLMWAIGNELNLRATNPKVWNAVNDISKMIHQIDPNHLTTTTLAGISQENINFIKNRCPDLDLLSIQLYGKLPELPNLIKKYKWNGPYIVSEWGATGHWEVKKTAWGKPIEENSTIKAANYLKRYQLAIAADEKQCLGSYVFLWGQKQERTPTWYGLFLENGKATESVDVMHYIWKGSWPKNRTPQIKDFLLNNQHAYDNVELKTNQICSVKVATYDFEGDALKVKYEILPEPKKLSDGGDFEERPKTIKIFENKENKTLKFKAPLKKGFYRIFVYVDDGFNHEATANIPFKVYE
ncbi:MAG: glycoside hydrolase family 2 TIM barrel-domain containing protein [Lutibacter sp.]